MKRILLLGALALGVSPVFAVQAAQMCFENRRVTAVNIGYVNGSKGPDGGYAVYFRLDDNANRWWPLNGAYNLNDTGRGPALHQTLKVAMAGNFRIRAYDHYGTMCDDVDEIEIYR